jgi:hypothetical protein
VKKYLIYCDFATLKCNRQQLYQFLVKDFPDVENVNNCLWTLTADENELPFNYRIHDVYDELLKVGYADQGSDILIVEIGTCWGKLLEERFAGTDDQIIDLPF